jgi:hypothetical protein
LISSDTSFTGRDQVNPNPNEQPIIGFAPMFAQQPVNPKFRSKDEEDAYNRGRELGEKFAPAIWGCCCLFVVAVIGLVVFLLVRMNSKKNSNNRPRRRDRDNDRDDDRDDDRPRRRNRDDDRE